MIFSLRARLIAVSLLTIAAALGVAGFSIADILRSAATATFTARLDGTLTAISAALSRDETTGALTLDAPPADPRFDRPLSGWYWQVTGDDGRVALAAASLWNANLNEVGPGPDGGDLVRVRSTFTPPGAGGAVTVIVAAPATALADEVAAQTRPALYAVALLGLALALAAIVLVTVGLRPLGGLREAVASVRASKTKKLPAIRIAEIVPLVDDLNALLAHSAASEERARRNAGDLAHGLKTPLAVIVNAARDAGRDPDGVIANAAARIERQLRHHLQRARIAGAAGVPGARSAVGPVLDDLVFMMRRVYVERVLDIAVDARDNLIFAGARQDLEEMAGNLLDNACKWARKSVRVAAVSTGGELRLTVQDDGPGMPPESRALALTRGGRLDESKPGHGFGLAIVAETAALYGGRLDLDDAAPGLRATLILPAGN
jgi:signal transduction histidine kinase